MTILGIKSIIKHFADVAIEFDNFNEKEKPVKKWIKLCNDFKDVEKRK